MLSHWLRIQRAKGVSPASALLWRLPRSALAHAVGAGVHAIHRRDLGRWHAGAYGAAIREAFSRSGSPPHVVVVVPDLLHFLLPCLRLATRHVPIVLVLNGARRWEERLLRESFPGLPAVRLRTLPWTVMPHGQAIGLLLAHAEGDIVLHDPDLYVFDSAVYRELTLREGELAVGPFGYTNRSSGLTFLTTPLLALRSDALRGLMERYRIGPELYRKTPGSLVSALRSIGIGDDNFPKEHVSYYDLLDLLMAAGIHDGYRLRKLNWGDDAVFHIGGVSYLDENYRLDYLHQLLLALPGAGELAERYRPRLGGTRSLEEIRSRFLADGAQGALLQIDSFVGRLAAGLARRPSEPSGPTE